ncbi:signal peptide peptidase SppA, 67K type [Psychromonas sp. CNPT3]|uniref:signal peptide peptidase SppA n=1 Tax=Psychromonas sp. CNPT3 TaxID=314282 RepID=UPI00006E9A53|nr:signal peptide peptidase SppA [Psychromonas sp. CNPT3]AGH81126.1 signal peptide peptidase SppA, 67K type [Psychromonas sp. CNPT3]
MKTLCTAFQYIAKIINITRLFFLNSIFILVIIGLLFLLNQSPNEAEINNNSILTLNFSGRIVEQKTPKEFSDEISKQLFSSEQTQQEYQVDDIINSIHHAQNDPKITAILLQLDDLQSASLNQIMDIGAALNQFKTSNKPVIASADNYSQIQYLLASYADNIALDPQGIVYLPGFSVYRLYFKDALDKLLITPHIFKVGTYKSFVEPFTQNHMSAQSKDANERWLGQLWQTYIQTVLSQRKDNKKINAQSISPKIAALKIAFKKAKGDSALYALQVGLVDDLTSTDDVLNALKKDAKQAGNKLTFLDYEVYQQHVISNNAETNQEDIIALIHGSGEIINGESNNSVMAGQSFSQLLQDALDNKRVKAVVIRLDSPGGSATASEKIRQKVLALKKSGKKVVISMASVSASGGYWIASAADHIVAYPTTLTGSIGIFALYASAEKALNKLGIYNDGVGTAPLSGLDPTRALDKDIADLLQMAIEHGYQQFLTVVSEGRHMSVEDVDKIAQGRVWTGTDAKRLGLVDQLGNLEDAIKKAAQLAKLDSYQVKSIQMKLSPVEQMFNDVFAQGVQLITPQPLLNSPILKTLQSLQSQTEIFTRMNDPQSRYAYCSMCIINH